MPCTTQQLKRKYTEAAQSISLLCLEYGYLVLSFPQVAMGCLMWFWAIYGYCSAWFSCYIVLSIVQCIVK